MTYGELKEASGELDNKQLDEQVVILAKDASLYFLDDCFIFSELSETAQEKIDSPMLHETYPILII